MQTPFSSDVAGPFGLLASSQALHRLFSGPEVDLGLAKQAP